jgi:hypothetical protein
LFLLEKPSELIPRGSLQDDYYLNLLDWSSEDQLAVGGATRVKPGWAGGTWKTMEKPRQSMEKPWKNRGKPW